MASLNINSTPQGEDDSLNAQSSKKENFGKSSKKMYVFVIAALAALNNCNLGYDMGIITGVGPILLAQDEFEVTEVMLELFIGVLDIASLLGAFSSNYLADSWGRKGCMALSEILFIISVIGMAAAPNFAVLIAMRAVCGVAVGLGLTIGPLYIGELAPDDLRGKLVSWSELATNVGLLVAFGVGYFLSGLASSYSWRLMLLLGSALPALLLVGLCFMPESPRWLLVNERNVEAQEVLQMIHDDDCDCDEMVRNIREVIVAEAEACSAERGGSSGWQAIFFPTPPVFYALVAALGIASIQQLSGIEAITNYFMFIFDKAGLESGSKYLYLVLFGVCKLVTVYFSAQYFDNPEVGRRPLLLFSGVGVSVAMLMFLIVFSGPVTVFDKDLAVAAMFWYVVAYSVGYGPGTWVVMLEVLPMHIRAKGLSLTTFVNRIMATILSSSFLTMVKVLSYRGYFLLFTIIAVCCLLFVYFYIPETQGRSLEEMSDVFSEISSMDLNSRSRASSAGEAYNPIWPGNQSETIASEPRSGGVAMMNSSLNAGRGDGRQRPPSATTVAINPNLSSAAATAVFEYRRRDVLNNPAAAAAEEDIPGMGSPSTVMQSLSSMGVASNVPTGSGGGYQRIPGGNVASGGTAFSGARK